jgi:hypothetical protein
MNASKQVNRVKEIMTTDRTFDGIYTSQDVYLSSKRDTHYTIQ